MTETHLAVFKGKKIRRTLHNNEWWFSIIDVCWALTESADAGAYWRKLKQRLKEEGSEVVTFCHGLKLEAPDSKMRETDCANTEGIFRIIQSIPSPKAEPFKRWLAKVGKERLDEIEQPSKAIERAKGYYEIKGYPKNWIESRTASIETRHDFTDVLKDKGVKSKEYAILTNEMYNSTFEMYAKDYKIYKGLEEKESLRDNMTPLELAATIFSEATATGFLENTE